MLQKYTSQFKFVFIRIIYKFINTDTIYVKSYFCIPAVAAVGGGVGVALIENVANANPPGQKEPELAGPLKMFTLETHLLLSYKKKKKI